jgi:hypothetical protein
MNSPNRLLYILSLILLCFAALPLYFLGINNEAIIIATMVVLYVFISLQLDLFIRIAKALKWSKTAVILVGFFGIKNIFFGFYFILAYKAGWIGQSWTSFLVPTLYLIYSVVIAKKLLGLNAIDFESSPIS